MMSVFPAIINYLAVVNVVAFFAFGIDKRRARRARWRISEYTLLMLAVVGGSIGALLGMRLWRHKTRHAKFRYGLPLILLAHTALCLLIILEGKKNQAFSPFPLENRYIFLIFA